MTLAPAPTDHVCPPDHPHDATSNCYCGHKCRCVPCRAANAARGRTMKRLKAYGRYDRQKHPVAPVLVHIIQLQRFGYSYDQIARAAGVEARMIYRCARGGTTWLQAPKARAILAVAPTLEDLDPQTVIASTGVIRRVQALGCNGWNAAEIARRAGLPKPTLLGALRKAAVTVHTHLAVASVYEDLWNTPAPASTAIERRDRTRSLNRAARDGWAPPLAWDDIDTDPEPQAGDVDEEIIDDVAIAAAVDGHHPHLTRAERLLALRRLHARGLWDPDLADLLSVSVKTIERDRELLGLESNYTAQMQDAA